MEISIRPKTRELLEARLGKGDYADVDELLRAALAALDELGGLDSAALDAIDEAEEDIAHGRTHDWAAVRASLEAQFPNK
jgi:Arc/MetJ-type ribon-helix-helix transcriptional regulator